MPEESGLDPRKITPGTGVLNTISVIRFQRYVIRLGQSFLRKRQWCACGLGGRNLVVVVFTWSLHCIMIDHLVLVDLSSSGVYSF